jgi:hypothetical protein
MTQGNIPMTDYPAGLATRLKLATRALVSACGGGIQAAALCDLSPAHISRCQSPDHPDTLSLAHLAILEMHAGRPIVAAVLADLTGCRVEVLAGGVTDAGLTTGLVRLAKESGEAIAALAAALQDGHCSPREGKTVLAELDDVAACVAALAGQLSILIKE